MKSYQLEKELEEIKKKKNYWRMSIAVVISSILIAASFTIQLDSLRFPNRIATLLSGRSIYTITTVFFIATLIAILFAAFLLNITMATLGGKGTYFDALGALAFSKLVLSIGFIISAFAMTIPYVGRILTFFVLTLFSAKAISVKFKFTKELFGTDNLLTLLGLVITFSTLVVAAYLVTMGITFDPSAIFAEKITLG